MKNTHHIVLFILAGSLLGGACTQTPEKKVSTIFHADVKEGDAENYDLEDLQKNGELIAVTLSGPDTYFEFRGQGFGLQYDLITDFAQKQGLRVRMEIAHDTTEMIQMLQKGEADVIALPIPKPAAYLQCAVQDSAGSIPQGWVTRANSEELTEALNAWYHPSIIQEIKEKQRKLMARAKRPSKHTPRPKMRDVAHGIISEYDDLFKRNAIICHWDWRLIAAQCYQESAFDPTAVSFAGAQGLMQLMPGTATSLGVQDNVFDPSSNINAAARLIKKLNDQLNDIEQMDERINFILASYNGGLGHVRDAMALTQKYGGNPHRWADVEGFILKLSNAQYYRDPVVKYGYLRGTETAGYVSSIRSHWAYYKSAAH